ncbi:UvrD-helicase domain-containing protein [Candidatus Wolfebacteria bacterium]|nr:UvrD-helicase domain-containing protein [Candidatus Wolfebacteria bacterium]
MNNFPNQGLNKSQQTAVDNLNGPLLIVAGAGSGKTRVLTSRLTAILDSGVNSRNVIAITFTNKAANEMRNRIIGNNLINLKAYQLNSLFIGTFHSLGVRILKNEAVLTGRKANFTIFDDDDSTKLVKEIIKIFNLSVKNTNLNHFNLKKSFSRIKNGNCGLDEKNELIRRFFEEYEAALAKNNAFDFDDLIEKPVKIFQNNPEILEKYRNQFQYILVDEFQDTNQSQYDFIKFLAGKHKNLSVVGDDSQSIYKFRGSDYRIFLDFEKDWPKTKVVLLEQNYRSSGNIIKAASVLISKNNFQKPKNLWTENSDGELIKAVEHRNENEEAEWVANKILNFKFSILNKNERSIGILYRTNAQSRAIESALIENGIAYKIFGGVKFYERKEIKDIVAALRFAFNPSDAVSFGRLKANFLKKPFLEIKENAEQMAKNLKPIELIGYVLKTADYFAYLKKHYANFEERVENINELIYFASGFSDLGEFLERISLLQSADNIKEEMGDSEKDFKVNLMTIHLAKGLEFDAVFIVGCNEGILPHQMSYHNEEEIEEERRLMYVAMTRAKKELFLNFYNLPSRFLSEIAPETVDFISNNCDKFATLSDFLDDEERYIEF